jgi:hypothetical protein
LSQQNKSSGNNGVRYWWPLRRVSLTDPKFAQFIDVFFVFFSEFDYFAHNKVSCNVFTFNSDLTCIKKKKSVNKIHNYYLIKTIADNVVM